MHIPSLLKRRQTLFVLVFLVVVVAFTTTFCNGIVRGSSMERTYYDGETVLVRRRTYFPAPLKQGDVVLLHRERGEVIIKRIFRLPGEEVTKEVNRLSNLETGEFLADYYEQQTASTERGEKIRYFVPEGFIVVLGDNADVSVDSRVFGPVPIRDIIGTVVNPRPQR